MSDGEGLESVDLVMALLELLSRADQPRSLGDIAAALAISKPRAHRHLRALVANGYVRQDPDSDRYELSAKLMRLGEAARQRFAFANVLRPAMTRLRDDTGQAITASALVAGQVTIVELIHGHTLIQFAIRPGTVMDPLRSAHGRVAMAFAPAALTARLGTIDPETAATIRRQGWATAPGEIVGAVNALAAPVFGHDGLWCGTIAMVGSIEDIAAAPVPAQIAAVTAAAARVSAALGWSAAA